MSKVKRQPPKRRAAKRTSSARAAGADRLARLSFMAFTGIIAIVALFALELPAKAGRALGEGIGDLGFRVENIEVKGASQLDAANIIHQADDQRGRPLPLVDAAAVRTRLSDYGWVERARILRRYPDTLVIDVIEREPAALWQDGDRLVLIDNEGVVLERVPVAQMPDLPLLLGDGANTSYDELARILRGSPALKAKLASAQRVGKRRWNLNVETGEILVLPEDEAMARSNLEKFMTAHRRDKLLGIGIERYDLRQAGQAVAKAPDLGLEGAN